MTACKWSAYATRAAQSNVLTPEARLLAISRVSLDESYVRYSANEFSLALDLLTEVLEITAELEERYDYRILFAHRVHIAANMIRIHAARGDISTAVALASELLLYLNYAGIEHTPGALRVEQRCSAGDLSV